MLGEVESERAGALVAGFLAGRSPGTRRAYSMDIKDFARFRDRSPAGAVAELLASSQQGRRIVLDYAVDMHLRRLAPATARRRIRTLRALVQVAAELGAADWSLEVPSEEDVAAEERARAGQGAYVAYFLPRDMAEIDRLDVQHYALRAALGGNYLAPVDRPARILDVGSGTGQWAYDLCAEFPQALAVGFDLEVSKRPWPDAYRFVKGNALQGLPFASDQFDFVHQRAGVADGLVEVGDPGPGPRHPPRRLDRAGRVSVPVRFGRTRDGASPWAGTAARACAGHGRLRRRGRRARRVPQSGRRD